MSAQYIHLLKGEQTSTEYERVNASQSVPTLVITDDDGQQTTIEQSIAILEYLEESRPDLPKLLPEDVRERAMVRQLVDIVACDIQPVTNLRVLQKVKNFGVETTDWQNEWMSRGLLAYEKTMLRHGTGEYSVGDCITMADVVLAPAVDGAVRFGVDLDAIPNVKRVYEASQQHPAFQKGSWRTQQDTPEEFRRA
jgi:maleylacetoacetate isomerase